MGLGFLAMLQRRRTMHVSNSNRREFLEQSMLATAAAVGSSAIPGDIFAADKAAQDKNKTPNEKIRIAMLGVRGQGGGHLSYYLGRKDVDVVAIIDPDEAIGQTKGIERAEKSSGKKPAYYKDLRKAFEDKNIDAVSIATPNHWHALAAIWAIQAGKHVYVEKPVSHNVSEGRRIVEAAQKHKKVVQTGTQIRSSSGVKEAIEYVQAGKLGEVNVARGLCYKGRPSIGPRGNYQPPASVDYDIWCGPAPKKELTRPKLHYDWHWDWDTGNGDLGNQGIHQMDICRWGLGVKDVGESVISYGGRLGYVDAGDTANTQVSIHQYGPRRIVFEVRGLKTAPHFGANVGVIFHGSEGYLVIGSYNGGAAFDPAGKLVRKFSGGGDHFGNFLSAVRAGSPDTLHAPILEGHLSSALCHLANISYRLGMETGAPEVKSHFGRDKEATETLDRVLSHLQSNGVDPEKTKIRLGPQLKIDATHEVFTGELAAQANPHLTREYRKPFVVPATKDL